MSVRILRSRDYAVLAWKNGLGVSHVIASQPPGAGYDAVDWQVGTTGITANCPFSSLPGLDRQFMVLEGEGVELHCRAANGDPDIRRRIAAPLEPFAFCGDLQTDCRLLGASVRVFNVLTRRGSAVGRVSVLTVNDSALLIKDAKEALLAFVAVGELLIDGVSQSAAGQDTLLLEGEGPEQCAVRAAGKSPARIVTVHLSPIRPAAGQ